MPISQKVDEIRKGLAEAQRFVSDALIVIER